MKPIKIYGESKTGTTYLQHLLEENTDGEIIGGSAWEPLGWKHGFPQHGNALYIFIFRNVHEWAKSLIAGQVDKRFNGLESKFGGTEYDFWNVWENPLQCRRAKYYSYLGFAEVNKSLLLNYQALRNNPAYVIQTISYNWGFNKGSDFKDCENHTYKNIEGRDNPNRKPLTEQQKSFIDSQIDPELESFVDNLTIQ